MINKARVRKLVKELRTTKKNQGHGKLHKRENTVHYYCCLGIGCEVAIKNGCKVTVTSRTPHNRMTVYHYDESWLTLPDSVKKWYGFSDSDPILIENKNVTASALNDDYNWSFKRIATAFEKRFLAPTKRLAAAKKSATKTAKK